MKHEKDNDHGIGGNCDYGRYCAGRGSNAAGKTERCADVTASNDGRARSVACKDVYEEGEL